MSKFKRVTSGLVGVAMAASMFTSMPFSAFAEDEAETNNQTYVYDDYEVSPSNQLVGRYGSGIHHFVQYG